MMIVIDHGKCSLCKCCVDICHSSSLSVKGDLLKIDYKMCSTCCQCVAYCYRGALSWDGNQSREINTEKLPDKESLLEMLKARRSTRKFLKKPIEKEKLEMVCQVAKLAPTNIYDIEVMVIQNREIIRELEMINLNFIHKVYRRLYANNLIYSFLSRITPTVNAIDKKKMERTLRRKSIFHNAPVLIMILADPRIYHAELSCQYALYNMILMTQSLGMGSCISGAGKKILSKNMRTRDILGIPKGKEILGILFMGYPDVCFNRTVEGNHPKIHWR